MRLERAHLEGIGPFETLTLELPEGTDPSKADVYLFTGPNGCGKSSLLYALAGGLGGLGALTQAELITRRMNAPGAFVEVAAGGDAAALVRFRPNRGQDPLHSTWTSRTIPGLELPARYHNEIVRYARLDGAIGAWEEQASGEVREAFAFAAFAYAGRPVLDPLRVEAIKELNGSPLSGALRFHDSAHSGTLAQWIANTRTKAALALRDHRNDVAERYEEAVRQIERALSTVLGEEFTFELGYEPLAVRIRQGGREIDADLLAEGAKSVVSWLADVYMRLERLPWIDARPTRDREFLLLLDEIDVYLHPSLQRRLLPAIQAMFPHAQIIATTHSPFVVASATDAWVYTLERDGAAARLSSTQPLRGGASYASIVRSIFGVEEDFDPATEEELASFYALRQRVLAGAAPYATLVERGESLAQRGIEVSDIVHQELRQVERKLRRSPAA